MEIKNLKGRNRIYKIHSSKGRYIFKGEGVINSEEFLEEYLGENGIPNKFRNIMNRYPSNKCSDNCDEPCSGGCPLIYKLFSPDKIIK